MYLDIPARGLHTRDSRMSLTTIERLTPAGIAGAVWQKGRIVQGLLDPGMVRKDWCGAWMQWHQYGRTDARFRWEVDHIGPIAHGGSDDLLNLQPLQWVTE